MKINASDLAHIADGATNIESHIQNYFDLVDGVLSLESTGDEGTVLITISWVNRVQQPLVISEKVTA